MKSVHAADTLVDRWERLQTQVRCGLHADQPERIRLYLHCGMRLARRGTRPALDIHLRMLRTLLCAGRDTELPWYWRSVCLEHLNLPVARLTTLIGVCDPIAMQAILAAVQHAHDLLPASPGAAAARASLR